MGGQSESTPPPEIPPTEERPRGPCLGCPVTECPAEDQPEGSLLVGWQLGLVSTGLFLGPVLLAIVGAMSLGHSPGWQLAGGIAGLGLGVAGSVGIARILYRGRKKTG